MQPVEHPIEGNTAIPVVAPAGLTGWQQRFKSRPLLIRQLVTAYHRLTSGQDFSWSRLDLSGIWGKQAKARGDALVACARPSGVTDESACASLRDEMLNELRAARTPGPASPSQCQIEDRGVGFMVSIDHALWYAGPSAAVMLLLTPVRKRLTSGEGNTHTKS